MNELITVVVATYNRPDALAAVLRGLAAQSHPRFEIVVADDGSGAATTAVVRSWASELRNPLQHVWHPDRGFRLAEIRNRAISKAQGDYLVFLDGDSIPRSDFVAAHRRLAEPGWFVAGNRVLLSPELTNRVLAGHALVERWGWREWLRARSGRDVNRLGPLVRLPLGPLRGAQPGRWQSARGGNLAIWRRDLLAVDGFDASFNGWGLEDSDVVIRLIRNGCRRKDGRFATAVLHLWHPEHDRSGLPDNARLLDAVQHGSRIQAGKGLSALHAEEGLQDLAS